MSLATANVLSLSRSPDGHRGKLHFLFEQMKHFGLNVMGLQECRTEEGHTKSNNILRYMSGHCQGQEGTEIWINLEQPIAYTNKGKPCFLAAHHCQIVQKDSRRLLLRVQSPYFEGWFFTGHAPHSGRMREERETWWNETAEILMNTRAIRNCFWLLDANAEPGPADDTIVFSTGLRASANTILFRECLHKFNMCLPSTSHIHRGNRTLGRHLAVMRPTALTMSLCLRIGKHIAPGRRFYKISTLQPRDMIIMRLDLSYAGGNIARLK